MTLHFQALSKIFFKKKNTSTQKERNLDFTNR